MTSRAFFAFARERHRIYLRRSHGLARGRWTKDKILATYRFTNVFRELDATTVWLRENVREPLSNDPRVFTGIIAFRWFNKIATGEILCGNMPGGKTTTDLLTGGWSRAYAERRLRRLLPSGPWVNGAYVIATEHGVDKLCGVLNCIDNFVNLQPDIIQAVLADGTLEGATNTLSCLPYMGQFMAYEVVTDLRHTYALCDAPDIRTWANPGPGARRGLARVKGLALGHYNSTSAAGTELVVDEMRNLLNLSLSTSYWPKKAQDWPRLEMRDVEHTLCEFDKYERARRGEGKPKQIYRP